MKFQHKLELNVILFVASHIATSIDWMKNSGHVKIVYGLITI